MIFHDLLWVVYGKTSSIQYCKSQYKYHNLIPAGNMKSLASITDNDIETIKMALNDSISDMTSELKKELSPEKQNSLTNYKERYLRVFDKLKANGSIYALSETDLDIVAGGLNDAIELIEENLTDDLGEEESEEILGYKNDCQRLVNLLAS